MQALTTLQPASYSSWRRGSSCGTAVAAAPATQHQPCAHVLPSHSRHAPAPTAVLAQPLLPSRQPQDQDQQQRRCQLQRCAAAGRPLRGSSRPSRDDVPQLDSSPLARSITQDIRSADSLPELENVAAEWGGSFDFIHTAAAMNKLAKLPDARSKAAQPLLRWLTDKWSEQLPEAGDRGMANVLWALGRLGAAAGNSPVWDSTLAAFVDSLESSVGFSGAERNTAQSSANVLWACAKARRQPTAEQLCGLLQAFTQPGVLQAALPQDVANIVWALSQLRTLRGFQAAAVRSEVVQQLLGQEQVQTVALAGAPQAMANTLLALARLATGDGQLLSLEFAQQRAQQLLDGAKRRGLSRWKVQEVTNALWASSELQLADEGFVQTAFASLSSRVDECMPAAVTQVATACVRLQRRDAGFMARMLQRGRMLVEQLQRQQARQQQQITKQSATGKGGLSLQDEVDAIAAMLSAAVALLDLQDLASDAVSLAACANFGERASVHPPHLARLHRLHVWLQQHGLLDGRGLTGLLTEAQLRRGAQEDAARHWAGRGL